jgi:hypothetical protein
MKKLIQILFILMIILMNYQLSFSQAKHSFFKKVEIKEEMSVRILEKNSERNISKAFSFSKFFGNDFQPKLSFMLLNGSGIHLFNTSKNDLIPAMNVGIRIKAGIIINI